MDSVVTVYKMNSIYRRIYLLAKTMWPTMFLLAKTMWPTMSRLTRLTSRLMHRFLLTTSWCHAFGYQCSLPQHDRVARSLLCSFPVNVLPCLSLFVISGAINMKCGFRASLSNLTEFRLSMRLSRSTFLVSTLEK
jgi:hypothetical protein